MCFSSSAPDAQVTEICREAIRLSFPDSKHVLLTATTTHEAKRK